MASVYIDATSDKLGIWWALIYQAKTKMKKKAKNEIVALTKVELLLFSLQIDD